MDDDQAAVDPGSQLVVGEDSFGMPKLGIIEQLPGLLCYQVRLHSDVGDAPSEGSGPGPHVAEHPAVQRQHESVVEDAFRPKRTCLRVCPRKRTDQLIRLNNGEWLRKEPKTTGSVRSITISAITASVLADHLDWFANAGPDGLVFPNGAGRPVISSSFWNNHFTPALVRTGVSCRFHDDLRHTSVALAIAAGAHPKAIQTRMGHSTIDRGSSQPQ